MKNKIRLEKQLKAEKQKRDQVVYKSKNRKISKAMQDKEDEAEANKRMQTEVMHQTEEAERRALGRAMLADAASNRPSFNNSSLKLLNNFQSKPRCPN